MVSFGYLVIEKLVWIVGAAILFVFIVPAIIVWKKIGGFDLDSWLGQVNSNPLGWTDYLIILTVFSLIVIVVAVLIIHAARARGQR